MQSAARPHPSSAPRTLSPVAVRVLDTLPDPPEKFTAADVLDALAAARADGVEGAEGASVYDVLGALLFHELASRAGDASGRPAYVVHPESRPF